MNNISNIIERIHPGSIAEEAGIESGDILLKINDKEVKDVIDYKFLICDEYITVEVEKSDGEVWILDIEKEYDEDLGVDFKNSILDKAKSCRNKCMFCFIDQLPKGMRSSLYFKDDDSRLSFLQGNFVTLTNMSEEDIDRIIRYRISPINVSVHTTNPELRKKMLTNRFAGNIMERLNKLAKSGIRINCQIVSCPGVNNGEELLKTIKDLYELHPYIENVAVVPVGVTKFREGLCKLNTYNKESAAAEIDRVSILQEKYIKEVGEPFVRLSDEFYILANKEVPDTDFYKGFGQLEDGVGMIRIFRNNIRDSLKDLRDDVKGSFTLITGASAYNEISNGMKKLEQKNNNIKLNVIKIINNYFGETITVAGLLTGTDIIDQCSKIQLGDYIIIPNNMLKQGEEVFLDDITIKDIEKKLNTKILVCDYSGEDIVSIINNHCKEEE